MRSVCPAPWPVDAAIVVVWNQSKFTVQTALGWVQALPQPELTTGSTSLLRNELLPIQEDIQMAGTCAARIKEAKVKPRLPLVLSMIGEHTFLQEHAYAWEEELLRKLYMDMIRFLRAQVEAKVQISIK